MSSPDVRAAIEELQTSIRILRTSIDAYSYTSNQFAHQVTTSIDYFTAKFQHPHTALPPPSSPPPLLQLPPPPLPSSPILSSQTPPPFPSPPTSSFTYPISTPITQVSVTNPPLPPTPTPLTPPPPKEPPPDLPLPSPPQSHPPKPLPISPPAMEYHAAKLQLPHFSVFPFSFSPPPQLLSAPNPHLLSSPRTLSAIVETPVSVTYSPPLLPEPPPPPRLHPPPILPPPIWATLVKIFELHIWASSESAETNLLISIEPGPKLVDEIFIAPKFPEVEPTLLSFLEPSPIRPSAGPHDLQITPGSHIFKVAMDVLAVTSVQLCGEPPPDLRGLHNGHCTPADQFLCFASFIFVQIFGWDFCRACGGRGFLEFLADFQLNLLSSMWRAVLCFNNLCVISP